MLRHRLLFLIKRADIWEPPSGESRYSALRCDGSWPRVYCVDECRHFRPLFSDLGCLLGGDLNATGHWICHAGVKCGVCCSSTAAPTRSAWVAARSATWAATARWSSAATSWTAATTAATATLIGTTSPQPFLRPYRDLLMLPIGRRGGACNG
jgi:hypothetical protein